MFFVQPGNTGFYGCTWRALGTVFCVLTFPEIQQQRPYNLGSFSEELCNQRKFTIAIFFSLRFDMTS